MTVIVFDLETIATNKEGVSHETSRPIQLAAVALDEKTFKIHEDEIFNTFINPGECLDSPTFMQDFSNVLRFHEKAQGKSASKLVEIWKNSPSTAEAFKEFNIFVKSYTKGSKKAYAGGMNILDFDIPILERLCKTYPFSRLKVFDIRHLAQMWFEYSKHPPKANGRVSYSFDALRDFFGLETVGAHDAKLDVLQEANILSRFLKLQSNLMSYAYKHREQPQFSWAKTLHGVK